MKERIRELMESRNLTQQEFAAKLQISPASLSSIFNDRTRPTLNHISAIQQSFPGINLEWLVNGRGEMFNPEVPEEEELKQPPTPSNELMFDFDSAEKEPATSNTANVTNANSATSPSAEQRPRRRERHVAKSNPIAEEPKEIDEPRVETLQVERKARQITEIRIFFDDQTWETFVPKK